VQELSFYDDAATVFIVFFSYLVKKRQQMSVFGAALQL
jgi:hypothetical protein